MADMEFHQRVVSSGQKTLDRVVNGATAMIDVEFDGPATAYIGKTFYQCLCSQGIKDAGEEVQWYGWQEAIELYGEQLRAMCAADRDTQLAWRTRPTFEGEPEKDGERAKYHVYSRLAFI